MTPELLAEIRARYEQGLLIAPHLVVPQALAHKDIGELLAEVDRLRAALEEITACHTHTTKLSTALAIAHHALAGEGT